MPDIFNDAISFPVPTAIAGGGTITLTASDYSDNVTISSNTTIEIGAGVSDGQPFKLILVGTLGGGVVSFGSSIKAPGSVTVALGLTYVCELTYIGGFWCLPTIPTGV